MLDQKTWMLKYDDVKLQLQVKLNDILACEADQQVAITSIEEDWKHIKDFIYKATCDMLGYQAKRHHQGLVRRNWQRDSCITGHHVRTTSYLDQCQKQQGQIDCLHQGTTISSGEIAIDEGELVDHKSQELPDAADQHHMKRFNDGLKTVYGPRNSGSAPVRSKDGSTLPADRG